MVIQRIELLPIIQELPVILYHKITYLSISNDHAIAIWFNKIVHNNGYTDGEHADGEYADAIDQDNNE